MFLSSLIFFFKKEKTLSSPHCLITNGQSEGQRGYSFTYKACPQLSFPWRRLTPAMNPKRLRESKVHFICLIYRRMFISPCRHTCTIALASSLLQLLHCRQPWACSCTNGVATCKNKHVGLFCSNSSLSDHDLIMNWNIKMKNRRHIAAHYFPPDCLNIGGVKLLFRPEPHHYRGNHQRASLFYFPSQLCGLFSQQFLDLV